MDWGLQNRLSKTIKPDGKCFYLAMDHGYFQGPTHCLEKPGVAAAPLLPYVDALFVTRGVLRAAIDPNMSTALILRVSGGTSMAGPSLANEAVTTSIEEIIRTNAAAVGISVYIGSEYEHQTLMALAKLVNECTAYGIPVMAVTAVGRETEKPTAAALMRMMSSMVVVSSSLARSLPTMLLPPETRRISAGLMAGLITARIVPRVMNSAST